MMCSPPACNANVPSVSCHLAGTIDPRTTRPAVGGIVLPPPNPLAALALAGLLGTAGEADDGRHLTHPHQHDFVASPIAVMRGGNAAGACIAHLGRRRTAAQQPRERQSETQPKSHTRTSPIACSQRTVRTRLRWLQHVSGFESHIACRVSGLPKEPTSRACCLRSAKMSSDRRLSLAEAATRAPPAPSALVARRRPAVLVRLDTHPLLRQTGEIMWRTHLVYTRIPCRKSG